MTTPTTPAPEALVSSLRKAARSYDGRSTMMDLRASLHERSRVRVAAAEIVEPLLPAPNPHLSGRAARDAKVRRDGFYLTAALYGLWHAQRAAADGRGMNFGAALAKLSQSQPTMANSILRELARVPREHLDATLERAVTGLSKAGIGLDWVDMAYTLSSTTTAWPERQRAWIQSYYRAPRRG